ncbi:hypothetical protein EGI16_07270 [Chryseobacterium sp. G0240]|uniref:hypothetical protein n=1 Tax=Chryseobacterium sp. G0240 TaxID=2487066 RepID=UPI000F44CE51|nr:hypothetical protein [Chryseobacterium sp. G0240]ROI05112.1 hypothetical protein EGI16_07270 [Chryseobacterium sp. G0240]
MKKNAFILFFMVWMSHGSGQVVIGSDQVSEASILKLDMENRALKIPVLSIPSKGDIQNPVLNPARGLLLYNTSYLISENLDEGVAYWGNNNQYYSLTTRQGIEDIINDSHIPLMIFSTTVGQKNNIPCGAGTCSGWTWTPFNPTAAEILIDSYTAWNTGNNTYTIPVTDTYVIEYSTNISNSSNGDGTSSQNIYNNGSNINNAAGRYISTTNRAYTTVMMVRELTKGDVLDFKYVYTQNNYRLQTGTVNIYKY